MSPYDVSCRGDRCYRFRPAHTALLVIDMQKDFFAAASQDDAGEAGPLHAVVPKVEALCGLLRAAGCRLVHTREGYSPDLSDLQPFRHRSDGVGRQGPLGRFLIRGEAGQDFLDELRPEAGETVLDKPGFGAFFATDLHAILQRQSITHLILCGVTTQCCVQSTLREAVDRGYWCLTVADCCAAYEPAVHEAALRLIAAEGHLFGWVADLADLRRACLNAGANHPE